MDKLCAGCGRKLVIDRAIDPVTGWEFHPNCLKKHTKNRDLSSGNGPNASPVVVEESEEDTSKGDKE